MTRPEYDNSSDDEYEGSEVDRLQKMENKILRMDMRLRNYVQNATQNDIRDVIRTEIQKLAAALKSSPDSAPTGPKDACLLCHAVNIAFRLKTVRREDHRIAGEHPSRHHSDVKRK